MPHPLDERIAALSTLKRRKANATIRGWLGNRDLRYDDLRYVAHFLRNRTDGSSGNEVRMGFATLYIATAGVFLSIFTSLGLVVVIETIGWLWATLGVMFAGVFFMLGSIVVDTFRTNADLKLANEVDLRAEIARRDDGVSTESTVIVLPTLEEMLRLHSPMLVQATTVAADRWRLTPVR